MPIRLSLVSDGRLSETRPAGLQEDFEDSSESEASTFLGFEEDALDRMRSANSESGLSRCREEKKETSRTEQHLGR